MRQSLRLGRVAGIPVGMHWSVLVIVWLIAVTLSTIVLPEAAPGEAAVLYWSVGVVTSVVFMVSLLAHELAHALVARGRGLKVGSITLWVLGGATEIEEEAETPGAELVVAGAGPLASLLLALGAFAASAALPGPPLLVVVLVWLAYMNLVLGVFNLLPGAPLDGGRVLHAVLWRAHRDRARADRAAAVAGQSLGFVLVILGFVQMFAWNGFGGLWLVIVGWYLAGAARTEATARIAREGLRGVPVGQVMSAVPDLAPAWQSVEEFVSTALRSHQRVFPVVDFSGAPVGVVSLEALTAVPAERRASTRLSTLARELTSQQVLAPDDEVVSLLGRPAAAGQVVAVVAEGGRVAGMVTTDDLNRVLQQVLLRGTA
ncbi:site-2 protease family protein [Planobispora siamensis]|uniref:Zinc metalloprotease n=1 Tax=Planobispora siamensis TaxID=936338 RepID=A0A8J3SN90_9ACTN|nr:site-2 protease family protein [Planobispora siamensis]GIH96330.1 putative zinc metalloprotease Rip3 [Planobispora siamensis]